VRKIELNLNEKIRQLPHKPGVYLMHDKDQKVIYIGKAKSLRKRVSSYFRHSGFASPRLRSLVNSIADISVIRTETEAEALIIEARLIKKYKPFFNVELKMGERYPYLKITSESYPRLVITRHKEEDGGLYLGPYTRVGELRNLLKLIQRYFLLRSCKMDLARSRPKRPCIDHSLGKCPAPCAGKCSRRVYRERVDDVILLLRGQSALLVERLRQRMEQASSRMDFEEAARHRDAIRAIWKINRNRVSAHLEEEFDTLTWEVMNNLQAYLNLPVLPWRIDGFDVSHTGGKNTYGVVVVFEQGVPNLSLYRRFAIRAVEGIDDFRSIRETVCRRYEKVLEGKEPLPQLILIDGGSLQLQFAQDALRELGLKDIPVIAIAKREELIFLTSETDPLRLSEEDPVLKLLQRVRNEAHRFAIASHRRRTRRSFSRSSLQDIPGVGKHLAALLLSEFGSIKNIQNLTERDLEKISGIGPTLASRITGHLRGDMNYPTAEKGEANE